MKGFTERLIGYGEELRFVASRHNSQSPTGIFLHHDCTILRAPMWIQYFVCTSGLSALAKAECPHCGVLERISKTFLYARSRTSEGADHELSA
jgi:hypothetical protein